MRADRAARSTADGGLDGGPSMPAVLYLLALGAFAVGTDTFVIAGLLSEMGRSLHVSTTVAGQLVTVFALTYAVLAPVAAVVTGRWSRQRRLRAALALFTAGTAVSAVAPWFWLAMVGRVTAAAGASAYTPAAVAAAGALAPEGRRGTALAIVISGLSAATALGVPLGTLVGGALGWRFTLLLVAVLGAAVMAGCHLPADAPAGAVAGLRERLAPLRKPAVLLVLATTLFALASEYTIYTYLSLIFGAATDGRTVLLSALLLAFGVGAVIGNAVAGPATDRWGDGPVLLLALVGVVAVEFLMPWTTGSLWPSLLAMGLWGVAGWGYLVPLQHRLMALAPGAASLTTSLNSSAIYLGASAGSVAGGVLITQLPARSIGCPAAAIGLLAIASALASNRARDAANAPASAANADNAGADPAPKPPDLKPGKRSWSPP